MLAVPVALAQPRVGGLPPGTLFGRYACVHRLARGGMAELYLARHVDRPKLEKLWVIKRVMPHLAESPVFVQMFQNEARLASTLDHPNVAAVVDYGVSGEEHYLVMEYVHGKDGRALLGAASASEGLSLACALTIVTRVAAALHYAHERRDDEGKPLEIVHRDVSPSNVLLGYDGTVRLADFGIAKAVAQTNATRTGTIKGKAGYMSPEQCRGEAVDRRSDVFGLGVLLHELTTLRRAFFAPSDLAVMSKVVAGDFRRPREIVPDYPEALEAIVLRAMSVAREDRFPTARAFQEAVEAFARGRGMMLSSVELAGTVTGLFGSPPYPAGEFADQVKTEVAPVPVPLDDDRGPARPRGGWRLPAVAAVTIGVAGFLLGIGLSDPEPVAPASPPAEVVTEAAASAPEAVPADEPAPPSTRSDVPRTVADPEPEATIVVEDEPNPTSNPRKRSRKARADKRSADKSDRRRTFGPPKWGN
jgi:serine/threonine protein kinase